MTEGIRTRFAPSPTGPLHTGGARTALFSWLFARSRGGKFVLRIDDTDTTRSEKRYEEGILKDLSWLGLTWDEGPGGSGAGAGGGGACGPYRQSERSAIYREAVSELLDKGLAYKCYCSRERLSELRSTQLENEKPPRYDRRCLALLPSDVPTGVKNPVVRFKVPEGSVAFTDAVKKEMEFRCSDISDFIIEASDGSVTYNFASAIDDALMCITHVVRGDDHLSNTPTQILILKALGHRLPEYAHLPLIVGTGGRPLSKREMSASLGTLREDGFLPEAVINALARLGWAPGDEGLLSLADMAECFELLKLSKSPSVFDTGRLGGFNRAAIAARPAEDFLAEVEKTFPETESGCLLRAILAVKSDVASVKDMVASIRPLTGDLLIEREASEFLAPLKTMETEDGNPIIALIKELEGSAEITEDLAKSILSLVKKETGLKGKALFMPIRVGLTGVTSGIELYRIIELLGREESVKRLKTALGSIGIE